MSGYGLRGFVSLILRDTEFRIIILVASTLWIFSVLSKVPFMVPSHYSDVGWLWIRDVYSGNHNLQIPYVQYTLEYPQMIGLLIYLGQTISTYFPVLIDSYNTFVAVEGLLEYPFMVGTIFNLYILCTKLNLSRNRIYLYMITTLTFIVYGFYNWDFLVAYFVTLSIWLYLDKRFNWAAVALAFGVLTKFTPGIMLFPMLAGLQNWRARINFTLTAAIVWVAANLPFAVANFNGWIQLFVGYSGPNHQLQNTWISMAVSAAGLGDIISGERAGWILSFGIFFFLMIYAVRSKHTPLEKILMTWYAWYGAVYLFDPQMMIQLIPIVILTPNFSLLFYRVADVLNAFIIMFYFIGSSHPQLPSYLTDQLTPFGLTNMEASLRQLIFLSAYFVCFNPKLQAALKGIGRRFAAPLGGSRSKQPAKTRRRSSGEG
ncbi:MAG: glycosyltransferase 87 family protein [Candidatus Bathyarchaeia archaeon]